MNTREFTVDGGRTVDNHKVSYPDSINVKMDRYRAFKLVKTLVGQLEDPECFIINFKSSGELINLDDSKWVFGLK